MVLPQTSAYTVAGSEFGPKCTIVQLSFNLLSQLLMRNLLVVLDDIAHLLSEVVHQLHGHFGSATLLCLIGLRWNTSDSLVRFCRLTCDTYNLVVIFYCERTGQRWTNIASIEFDIVFL